MLVTISDILNAPLKPKEKTVALSAKLKEGVEQIEALMELYATTKKDGDKGTCIAALTLVAEEKPAYVEPCLDFVMDLLSAKQPRVKWEAAQIIAHVAHTFPEAVCDAIPELLENTRAEGTVVRWSAAFALTEIAKANPEARAQLVPFIEKMAATEGQNGVRAIYAKALKALAAKPVR